MTPNLDFKVTIFINVKYLENGMAGCHQVVYDLPHGAIFNDLE